MPERKTLHISTTSIFNYSRHEFVSLCRTQRHSFHLNVILRMQAVIIVKCVLPIVDWSLLSHTLSWHMNGLMNVWTLPPPEQYYLNNLMVHTSEMAFLRKQLITQQDKLKTLPVKGQKALTYIHPLIYFRTKGMFQPRKFLCATWSVGEQSKCSIFHSIANMLKLIAAASGSLRVV